MNKLESFVYHFVKHNPRIKNFIRDIYQALLYAVPVPTEKASYPVNVREGYFFGFHDKNPWSSDNQYLLAHGFHNLQNREPEPGDTIHIGFFTGEDFTPFQKVASTACYNWQQGSMLQWLGTTGNLIFNDAGGDENTARILTCKGELLGVLPKAIAAVDPEGKKAVSYNFARLQRHFPGYGYLSGKDPEIEMETPSSHGLSIIDIGTNRCEELFTVKDIASIMPEKSMNGSFHFLTHCLFSPNGKRFLFLHRWIKNKNFTHTRMFSCDVNGQNLHLFPTHNMVSHIAWQDDLHVLAYARSVDDKDAYILFRDLSDEFRLIGTSFFSSDGHPSFPRTSPDWFVTDTYPDRLRQSYLMLFNMIHEKRYDIGIFREPYSFRDTIRCDLHPRWNHDGTMICFDSAHTGKRSLCTMNLGNALSTGVTNLH
jgi:hypothetical protein